MPDEVSLQERWLLNSKVAEAMSSTRWQGLSFMPRTGRRPNSGDFVLASTYENGRMRPSLEEQTSPRRPREGGARMRLSARGGESGTVERLSLSGTFQSQGQFVSFPD